MTRRLASSACLLSTLGLLGGCQTWHPVAVRPGVPAFSGRVSEVRITLEDGSVTTLNSAIVMADTVMGTSSETLMVHRTPNAAIRTLELRQVSKTRTTSLIVANTSVVVSLIAIIVWLQPHYDGAFWGG